MYFGNRFFAKYLTFKFGFIDLVFII